MSISVQTAPVEVTQQSTTINKSPVVAPDELLPPCPDEDNLYPPLVPTALCPPGSVPNYIWSNEPAVYSQPAASTAGSQQEGQVSAQQTPQAMMPGYALPAHPMAFQMGFPEVPTFRPSNFLQGRQDAGQFVTPRRPRERPSQPSGFTGEMKADGVMVSIYVGVNVYELNVRGISVMRRVDDGWFNATHILKVADVDRGRRARILDRELGDGIYETIQGGNGRYQGTWIPMERARTLARDFGVEKDLEPLFDVRDIPSSK